MKNIHRLGSLLAGFLLFAGAAQAQTAGSFFFSNNPPNLLGSTGLTIASWEYSPATGALSIQAKHTRKSDFNPDQLAIENELKITGALNAETGELVGAVTGAYKSYEAGKLKSTLRVVSGTIQGTRQQTKPGDRLHWVGEVAYNRETGIKVISEKTTFKLWAPPDFTLPAQGAEKTAGNTIRVRSIVGEVEYSRDGGKTFVPLTKEVVLQKGDLVSTGYDATAEINFGYGKLTVAPLTQLRLDEFTSEKNLEKTQLYMRVGTVRANVPHEGAIRSDFAVRTPNALSSIRGSEMIVVYDEVSRDTTTYVTEHKAYVKGDADHDEREIGQGKQIAVAGSGSSSEISTYDPAALPALPETSSVQGSTMYLWALLLAVVIVAAYFFVFKKRS